VPQFNERLSWRTGSSLFDYWKDLIRYFALATDHDGVIARFASSGVVLLAGSTPHAAAGGRSIEMERAILAGWVAEMGRITLNWNALPKSGIIGTTYSTMRLSLQTDFALRTLMFLVARGARASVNDVAVFFGISRDHLSKVAQRLSQAGYIRTVRGLGGGLELIKSPNDIRIGEVIEAFEGSMHLLDCVAVSNVCVIQPGCLLRGVLAEAERVQRDYLNSIRLSDIIAPQSSLVELTIPESATPTRRTASKTMSGRSRRGLA
jgi:Rrf2 family transcriptional regulator, nitric oxide-sensitive transcriptional repressor